MSPLKIDPMTSITRSFCPANDSITGCQMDREYQLFDGKDIIYCSFHEAFSEIIGRLDKTSINDVLMKHNIDDILEK